MPVSLTVPYDKVHRTESEILRAHVRASAARLAPAMAELRAAPACYEFVDEVAPADGDAPTERDRRAHASPDGRSPCGGAGGRRDGRNGPITGRPSVGRHEVLLPLDAIGLSREEAAVFIAVSPALFAQLVELGVMPRPKAVGTRRIWDRKSIERAWQRLLEVGEEKPELPDQWSDVQASGRRHGRGEAGAPRAGSGSGRG